MRFLSALAVLVAGTAYATTWTCTKDLSEVQEGYYEVIGFCTGTGNYTTGGGDAIGSTNTALATAQAVCGTSAQILVDLMTSSSADGNVAVNAVCGFDHTNFKYVCSVAGTAGAANPLVETTMAAVPSKFRFRAVCK